MNIQRILKTPALLVMAMLLILGCFGPKNDSIPERITTIILIRHAERDNFFILTDHGHNRAKALVDAVGAMDITAIYSPNIERDLDTVKPIANHLGINITLIAKINKSTVEKIVGDILAKHTGEVVLLVGNGSGNLRRIHQRLGGTGDGPYLYGDLFIYSITGQGAAKITKMRYGT
jgi:hypothetical protein